MTLTEQHIAYIENNLTFYGITSKDLKEDLLDHICTYIESRDSHSFDILYQEALQKFGGYSSFQNLQRETNHQKFTKQLVTFHKIKTSVGFLVILLLVISLVFQMMQWPYANAWLLTAIALSILVILPIHFYAKHKISVHKYS